MNLLYNFSDEFYIVPSIDIIRIFFTGFFIGVGIMLIPKVQNYLNKLIPMKKQLFCMEKK